MEQQKVNHQALSSSASYFKNFKQQLHKKYDAFSKEQLLQKLIGTQIINKKLSNRLSELEPFKQKNLRIPNTEKSARLFQQNETGKFALKICYLGHLYDGMALQFQTQNTIEEYLFRAMHTLNLIQTSRPKYDYTRAGRTDKGVSAMGNVICLKLRTKVKKIKQNGCRQLNNVQGNNKSSRNTQQKIQIKQFQQERLEHNQKPLNYCDMLNSILPQDIRILACQPVPQQFNARYWCRERSYKYFFVKNNLNIEKMKQAIKSFQGKHNFINFCKMNLCNTVNFQRQIMKANIIKVQAQSTQMTVAQKLKDDRNQVFYFHYVGNSFLWHQIRFMSSVLFMIGQGSEPVSIIQDLLNVEKYPRKPNYTMALEYPLILQDCLYQNLEFKPNPETIFKFYNTFHQMLSQKTIEKTLIVNCMHMAKQDLLLNIKISNQAFIQGVLESYTMNHKIPKKSMALHKASGRGMHQAIKSLKGKKKELYEKKARKQADFQEKQLKKHQEQKYIQLKDQ